MATVLQELINYREKNKTWISRNKTNRVRHKAIRSSEVLNSVLLAMNPIGISSCKKFSNLVWVVYKTGWKRQDCSQGLEDGFDLDKQWWKKKGILGNIWWLQVGYFKVRDLTEDFNNQPKNCGLIWWILNNHWLFSLKAKALRKQCCKTFLLTPPWMYSSGKKLEVWKVWGACCHNLGKGCWGHTQGGDSENRKMGC